MLPLIEFPEAPLDWGAIFPVRQPVAVEIGAGKGRFLIRAAELHPGMNWVGLERRWSALALAVERIARKGLTNAVYVRCDALEIVRRMIPAGSVAAFHIYYPDPWWKKRHHKRRIFTPAFVSDLARALQPGGELRVATDVREYFDDIVGVVRESGLFEARAVPDASWGPAGEPLTSYEAKYLQAGRTASRAAFRRGERPAPPPEPWLSRKPRSAPLGERLITPRLTRGSRQSP